MPAISKRFFQIIVAFVLERANEQQRMLQVEYRIAERHLLGQYGSGFARGQGDFRRCRDEPQPLRPWPRSRHDPAVVAPTTHGQATEQTRCRVVGMAFEVGGDGQDVVVAQP